MPLSLQLYRFGLLVFTLIPQRMLCVLCVCFFFQFMLVGPFTEIVHKLEGGTPFMEKEIMNRKERDFGSTSHTFGESLL